jgi:hypothetical protein
VKKQAVQSRCEPKMRVRATSSVTNERSAAT